MKKLEKGVKTRLLLVSFFLVTGLSLMSARLVYVQFVEHDVYAQAAARHYCHREVLPATRGMIVDRDGNTLARNQTVYFLTADPFHLRDVEHVAARGVAHSKHMKEREVERRYNSEEIVDLYYAHIADKLSPLLRTPPGDLNRKLKSEDRKPIVLSDNVEEDLARQFRELMDEEKIRGVHLVRHERRYYPSPLSLTHVLGYVQEMEEEGENGRPTWTLEGREGVEKVFDDFMEGTPGYRLIERDSWKREIHAFRGEQVLPKSGKTVRLTIDMGLQTKLEHVLDEAWETYKPEKISSVWMDPKTGEILAMASRPHFDLATRKGTRRNIAVSDVYEPGSTFKLVSISGSLNQGVVSPSTTINCYGGRYEKDGVVLVDHGYYDHLTVEDVIRVSSNVGAYMVGRQMNRGPFFDHIRKFGFGEPTGVELTGEIGGLVYPIRSEKMFSRVTMGYAIGVTPLQMTNAYCVVANGGELLQPRILKSIEDESGKVLEKTKRTALRRVISERTAEQMRRAFLRVTQPKGTGTRAAIPGYDIGGKTGTAQKNIPGKGYAKGRYVVSFAGFLPADDPELVGLVVVDDPRAEGTSLYGGTVAAPIWREVAMQATRLLAIPPKNPDVQRLADISMDEIMEEHITD